MSNDIAEAVKKVKSSEEWRTEYMTLLMRDRENIEKGRYEAFFTAVSAGKMSSEDAAELAGVPVSQFEKQMAEAGYRVPASV